MRIPCLECRTLVCSDLDGQEIQKWAMSVYKWLIDDSIAMAKGWLNSTKLEAMPYRVTQDGQVKVKSSDKRQSTWGGNGNSLHYSCLENSMNSVRRENIRHWKMSFLGQKVSKMLLWKSRGQLLIVPGKKIRRRKKCCNEQWDTSVFFQFWFPQGIT